MQNKLIPLTVCPESPGEYQPALVPDGYQYRRLVRRRAPDGSSDGFSTEHDDQGFRFRNDLDGFVRGCGAMRIIELDSGELFAVQNPHEMLLPL